MIRFFVRGAPTQIHSADAREARSSRADGYVAGITPGNLARSPIQAVDVSSSCQNFQQIQIDIRDERLGPKRPAGLVGATWDPFLMPRRTPERYEHTYRDRHTPALAVRRRRNAHRACVALPTAATIDALRAAYDGFTKAADVTSVTSIAGENRPSTRPKSVRFFCNASREICREARFEPTERRRSSLRATRFATLARPVAPVSSPATRLRRRRLAADARRPRLR